MYMCCVHAVRVKCGDQGTPGRTSDPLQSTKCRTCHAKATGRPAETKGRQGVHPTPCEEHQVPHLPRKSHRQGTPGRTSDPLQSIQAPHLPHKSHWPTGGDQGTPRRTSDPLQSTKCHTCHAKATGRPAETKGRQGLHLTACRASSAAPATQKPPAERRRPRDARAYIRPLVQSTKCRTCHAKVTGRPAETKGRQGVHPTPCRAPSAAPAKQKPPADRRRPRDTRAYIRPLAEFQVPHLSE